MNKSSATESLLVLNPEYHIFEYLNRLNLVDLVDELNKEFEAIAIGRAIIDLLTSDKFIEFKKINNWKVVLKKIADIEAACLTFDVNVTAEEV